uniref:Nuclear migration protein nudC n=1 Tax=Chaetoceros debilis TaxID=122233 RepID=A0A7S3QHU3_9STRA
MSDFSNDERFDGLYINVAQTTRGIEPLLDTVFSFLRRKTDFFHGPRGEDTDAAVTKVNEVLNKHVQMYKQQRAVEEERKEKQAKVMREKKAKADRLKAEKKAKEEANRKAEEVKNAKTTSKSEASASDDASEDVIELSGDGGFDISNATGAKAASDEAQSKTKSNDTDADMKSEPEASTKATAAAVSASTSTKESNKNDDKTKKDDSDDDPKTPPPPGNGGTVPGKYIWTQTLAEVNLTIALPENTRGRDLNVVMKKTHLKVQLKSQDTAIVDAKLTKTIICDDSFWTVEDGNRLVVNLQKLHQMEWWNAVCIGDPEIDVTKVQPENSKLDELDGETRQTVEKMMFDQRQKALGLPSSEEQKKFDALEKFKQAHPEMDFSNAKMS